MTDERGSLATRVVPLAVGVVLVALAAVVAAGAFPANGLSDDAQVDGDEVVDRVGERYENARTYSAETTVTVENATRSASANVSVVVARPNSTRVTVSHNGSADAVGTNGSVAWAYDEANGTARVWDLPDNESEWNESAAAAGAGWNSSAAAENASRYNASMYADWNHSADANVSVSEWLDENVSAEVLRTTTYEGSETYVVGLEPENESYRGNATLWVDAGDYRVHKMRAGYGDNRTTVTVHTQTFNASVHESTFQPPDAASVMLVGQERYDTFDAAQAGTDVTLQRLDAVGYEFEEAVVVTRAGRTVAAQQYVGEVNVTLVATADDVPYLNESAGEPVTVAGEDATYVERDDGSAVVWETDDGVTRAVLADLSREELVELADSVRS